MKNTSRTMYRFGNLVNFIFIGVAGLIILISVICLIVGLVGGDSALTSNSVSSLFGGIYWTVACVLAFIFVGKAQKELADESTSKPAPYIVTIVFGAITGNPLYVLAGIFGLIAEGQQGGNNDAIDAQPVEEEKPVENDKAE